MGRMMGIIATRAKRSPSRSRTAPARTEPGMRYTWLLPTTIRTIGGATSPMKLISPTRDTMIEQVRQHRTMFVRVSLCTWMPRLTAVSSPLSRAL